jgi:hypothetical protein
MKTTGFSIFIGMHRRVVRQSHYDRCNSVPAEFRVDSTRRFHCWSPKNELNVIGTWTLGHVGIGSNNTKLSALASGGNKPAIQCSGFIPRIRYGLIKTNIHPTLSLISSCPGHISGGRQGTVAQPRRLRPGPCLWRCRRLRFPFHMHSCLSYRPVG